MKHSRISSTILFIALIFSSAVNANTDTDLDGVSDEQEVLDGSDPEDYFSILDTDKDGVPDFLESTYGSDINVADALDSDNDGVIDYIEAFPGGNDAPKWTLNYRNVKKETLQLEIENFSFSRSPFFGDIDDDGDEDIIVAASVKELDGTYNGSYYWFEFCSTNEYCRKQKLTDAVGSDSMRENGLIDFDNDGDLDLLSFIQGVNETSFVIYENCLNESSCNLWQQRTLTTVDSGYSVSELIITDMDNDQDFDILFVLSDSNSFSQVGWLENGSEWRLEEIGGSFNEFNTLLLDVGDVDGDDSVDVVVAVNNYGKDDNGLAKVYAFGRCDNNLDCNGWNESLLVDVNFVFNSVDLFDVDEDGDIDIVTTSRPHNNEFSNWFENCLWESDCLDWQATKIFGEVSISHNGNSDLNKDGRTDLVSVDTGGQLYLSEYCSPLDSCQGWRHETVLVGIDEVFAFVVGNRGVVSTPSSRKGSLIYLDFRSFNDSEYRQDIKHSTTSLSLPISARDADGQDLTYSINGTDAAILTVNPSTGEITYPQGFDFGNPTDVGFDNTYEFNLVVSDGELSDSIAVTFTVQSNVDSDLDGVVDYLEVNAGTDPNDKASYQDTDGDLVPDELEAEFGGAIDVADAVDSDNDGVIDYLETYSGLNDAPVWLSLDTPAAEPTTAELMVTMVEGREYVLFEFAPQDADGDDMTITIEGDDASLVQYSVDGRISPVSLFDYLAPSDMDKDNVLSFDLVVSDGVLSNRLAMSLTVIRNGVDNDNDGVLDTDEISQGTDRNDPLSFLDTDGDGVPDSLESYFGHDVNVSDALDSDGDGVSNYVELFSGENDAPIWLAETGNFSALIERNLTPTADISAVEYKDFNFDGEIDFVVFDKTSRELSVSFNSGGTFTQRILDVSIDAIDELRDLGENPLGQPEVLLLSTTDGTLNRLTYDSVRDSFSISAISVSQGSVGSVVTSDVDSDGDIDVVYLTSNNELGWLENGNNFSERVINSSGRLVVDFQVNDINGDNKKDVVVIGQDSIYWFDNTRDWAKVEIEQAEILEYTGIALSDMDNDSDVDVVLLYNVSNVGSLFWLENGANWKSHNIASNVNANAFNMLDVNVDGLVDVVTQGNALSVYVQGETWKKQDMFVSSGLVSGVAWVDVDLDSDIDILVMRENENVGELVLYSNDERVETVSLLLLEGSVETGIALDVFDPDGNTISFSIEGRDKDLFSVNASGEISLNSLVGFVVNQSNVHNASVIASDGEYSDVVDIVLTIISAFDSDNDGTIDYYDLDDDNDLVPDLIEYRDGTSSTNANDFLDVDKNGQADFVQITEFPTSISYQISLAAEVQEGGYTVVDLHNVSSPNGDVNITATSDELTLVIENSKLYIYADYVSATINSTVTLMLDDGVHNTSHTFPVKVMNVIKGVKKIELIKEQKSSTDELRLKVQSFNFDDANFTVSWYLDGDLANASLGNTYIAAIQSSLFSSDSLRVKVKLYNEMTGELFTDQIELLRSDLVDETNNETKLVADNKALSFPMLMVWFCSLLVLLKRQRRTLIVTGSAIVLSGCASFTSIQAEPEEVNLPVQQTIVKEVTLSFGMDDPLYAQKKAKEKEKEEARLAAKQAREEAAALAKVKKLHLSTLGF